MSLPTNDSTRRNFLGNALKLGTGSLLASSAVPSSLAALAGSAAPPLITALPELPTRVLVDHDGSRLVSTERKGTFLGPTPTALRTRGRHPGSLFGNFSTSSLAAAPRFSSQSIRARSNPNKKPPSVPPCRPRCRAALPAAANRSTGYIPRPRANGASATRKSPIAGKSPLVRTRYVFDLNHLLSRAVQ